MSIYKVTLFKRDTEYKPPTDRPSKKPTDCRPTPAFWVFEDFGIENNLCHCTLSVCTLYNIYI